jgi:hypothetical protein
MSLEIYAWTCLITSLILYVAFIREIEWHFKMANLVLFTITVSWLITLGILFLWQ